MEISSFGLVCEYVNCSDVRISCNNCMWSGTIIPQRGGGVSQHILAPKIIWRYFVQNQGGNWVIYLRDPPRLKREIIPNPSSCYQGRCQNAQNAQTRGGGSIIPCRRLCAFCTNGFNTAAPKWSDFLFWNRTFLGKKIQNWSDFRCIFRCIALNWYFSREWNDKGIVLRYLKTWDFQNCQFLSHKGWPYIKMG